MSIARFRHRRCATALLCAVAGNACGLSANAGPTLVDWLDPVNGDWFDATRWSGGVVPNNGGGIAFAVRLGGASPYTVTLNASAAISSLEFAVSSTVAIASGSALNVVGGLALNDGVLHLAGGSVNGGTWTGSGGTVRFESGARIDSATFANTMTIFGQSGTAALGFSNITLASGADVRLGADSETFDVTGAFTIQDGATLRAGGRVIASKRFPTTTRLLEGATLTNQVGGLLSFVAPAILGGDGTGQLHNHGVMNLGTPPSATNSPPDQSTTPTWLTIESSVARFENTGLINLAAGSPTSIDAIFSNSGQIDIYANTLSLNGAWENTGSINLVGPSASLVLGGVFSTASTEGLSRPLFGSIFFDGVMENHGATTTLQTGHARWTARDAIIEGGTVDGRAALSQRAIVGSATVRDATLLTPSTWNLFSGDRVTLERTTLPDTTVIGLDGGSRLTLRESDLPEGIRVDARFNSVLQTASVDHVLRGADIRLFNGSDVKALRDTSLTLDAATRVTIAGLGSVFLVGGEFGSRFTNNGVIQAGQTGAGTVVNIGGGASEVINRGSIIHTGRGVLEVERVINEQTGVIGAILDIDGLIFHDGLTNHGIVIADGATTTISGGLLNTGSISVSNADLAINTPDSDDSLTNTGVIDVMNGNLSVAGTYSLANLGTINVTGSAHASGTIANAGETLDLESLGTQWTLDATVAGGSIRFGDASTRARIDTLSLRDASILDLQFRLLANEALALTRTALQAGAVIDADSGAALSFSDGVVNDVAFSSNAPSQSGAPTFFAGEGSSFAGGVRFDGLWDLELGSFANSGEFEMSGGGALDIAGLNDGVMRFTGGSTSLFVNNSLATFTSDGEIFIGDGATLVFDRAGFVPTGQIVNNGVTRIESGGTLVIDRPLNTSSLGTLHNEGRVSTGEVTLTNTGNLLRQFGQGVIETNGLVDGGAIDLGGGTLEFSRTLRDVAIENGHVVTTGNLSTWSGQTSLRNGSLTLASNLRVLSTDFDAADVSLDGNDITFEGTSQILASTSIRGRGEISTVSGPQSPRLLNHGTIENDEAGSTLSLRAAIDNEGTISAANGATIATDSSRIVRNRGLLEATSGATLDLTYLFPHDDGSIGTVRATDATIRWKNNGAFTGHVDLNSSLLVLASSIFTPSDIVAFDLDDESSFRFESAALELGGADYAFERDVAFGRAAIRNGALSTPNPVEGEMELTFTNASLASGDLIFTGISTLSSTTDPTANGVTRNRGGTLSVLSGLSDDVINESGTLRLIASAGAGSTLSGHILIEGGMLELAGEPAQTVTSTGMIDLAPSSGDTATLSSTGARLIVLGTLSLGEGSFAEFGTSLGGAHELGNFNALNSTLVGGRFVLDGGTLSLGSGAVVATNSSDVVLRGAARFDALAGSLQSNIGRLALADGFALDRQGVFANVGQLEVDDAFFSTGTLVNSGSASVRGASRVDVAGLSLLSSSSLELTITQDTSLAPLLTVAGDAALAGSLSITTDSALVVGWGDVFEILEIGGDRTGAFASIDGPESRNGVAWVTEWIDDSLFVRARDWADLDDNGVIDFADLNAVLTDFGLSGSLSTDIDGDGVVAFSDLNIVLSRFGASAPTRAVPTPGAATAMLLLGSFAGSMRRRRMPHGFARLN